MPVLHVQKETVEGTTTIPRERMSGRFVERVVDVPARQKQEESVKDALAPQEHMHGRTVEQKLTFLFPLIEDEIEEVM